ncbi:MAG: Rv3235 family protein [Ornithinimicrobium sp.]
MSAQPILVDRTIAAPQHKPLASRQHGPRQQSSSTRLRVLPIPSVDPEPLTPAEFAELARASQREASHYEQIALCVDFAPGERDPLFAPQPTSSHDLPHAADWSRQVLRVLLEVMDGLRDARQISRWVSPAIRDRVARRGVVSRRRGGRSHRPNVVLSVHVGTPRDGVAEVSALVVHNGRHRAVALQLTGVDGRWLVTALEIG